MMFTGSAVAIVTPFRNGEVDLEALEKLVQFQLDNGTQAIVPLGTTGEASTLTFAEREDVIRTVLGVAKGKVPVIVGAGSNNTRTAIQFCRQAEDLGADGLLVITPYYNKTSPKGLQAHFRAVAAETRLPIILYNVPSRTGMNLPPETLEALGDVNNIVGVKEASGNISQILEIRRRTRQSFAIVSGNDDQILPIMACGGQGVISVAANIIPRQIQDLCLAYLSGDTAKALELQLRYKPLIDLLFCETNPIPLKAALGRMNMIDPELRLPLVPITPENMNKLETEMQKQGLVSA